AEDGIRDKLVTGVQTCALPISNRKGEIVIPQVPAGHYTMRVWSETAVPENLNSLTREVTVSANTSTLGIVQITGGAISTAHKNKYGMDYEPPAPNSPVYTHP